MEFYTQVVEGIPFTVPTTYQNLTNLGGGVHGTVCSATDTITLRRVAIKKLSRPFRNARSAERAYREFKIMRLVRHTNVIRLLNAFTPQGLLGEFQDVYFVMELMDKNLSQVIPLLHLRHEHISYLLYQLLCGVKHLHSGGIIHRDLKPTNIVVNTVNCKLKILDLGLARTTGNEFMTPYVATRHYRAPEIILTMDYQETVDMWSVGCIMAEMIRGQVLLPGTDCWRQWNVIVEVLGTPSPDFLMRLQPAVQGYVNNLPHRLGFPMDELLPDHLFTSVIDGANGAQGEAMEQGLIASRGRDLLSRMLQIDPERRISVDDALLHPFVNIWFDGDEVHAPAPEPYVPPNIDEGDNELEQWRALLYHELMEFQH